MEGDVDESLRLKVRVEVVTDDVLVAVEGDGLDQRRKGLIRAERALSDDVKDGGQLGGLLLDGLRIGEVLVLDGLDLGSMVRMSQLQQGVGQAPREPTWSVRKPNVK